MSPGYAVPGPRRKEPAQDTIRCWSTNKSPCRKRVRPGGVWAGTSAVGGNMIPVSDNQVCVRPADDADLAAVAAIHRHYVENTLVCVPETERTMAQWKEFADDLRTRGLPFLVALEGEELLGYACVYPWKPGPSYRYAGEVSTYLAPGHTDRRLGDALMQPLIEASREAGLRQLIGAVAQTPQRRVRTLTPAGTGSRNAGCCDAWPTSTASGWTFVCTSASSPIRCPRRTDTEPEDLAVVSCRRPCGAGHATGGFRQQGTGVLRLHHAGRVLPGRQQPSVDHQEGRPGRHP